MSRCRCRAALALGTTGDAELAADIVSVVRAAERRDQAGVSSAESALNTLLRKARSSDARGVARIVVRKPS